MRLKRNILISIIEILIQHKSSIFRIFLETKNSCEMTNVSTWWSQPKQSDCYFKMFSSFRQNKMFNFHPLISNRVCKSDWLNSAIYYTHLFDLVTIVPSLIAINCRLFILLRLLLFVLKLTDRIFEHIALTD